MQKYKIYIILGVIALVAIFLIIYLSEKSQGSKVNLLVSEEVQFPHLTKDGKNLYYLTNAGNQLKKYNLENKSSQTIFDNLPNVFQAFWSADDQNVILKNDDPQALSSTQIYNLKEQTSSDLNTNIESLIWAKDSQKIYYHYFDEENNINQIDVANADGSAEQKIIDLQYPIYQFVWINEQNLGYWTPPTDVEGVPLHRIDLISKIKGDIFTGHAIGDVIASPDDQYIAFEKFHQKNTTFTLAISDSGGKNEKDSGIETSVLKTAWFDNQNLITALRENNSSTDSFYKISATTGGKSKIIYQSPNTKIDAQNLIVSSDGKNLYFISDNKLYKLALK